THTHTQPPSPSPPHTHTPPLSPPPQRNLRSDISNQLITTHTQTHTHTHTHPLSPPPQRNLRSDLSNQIITTHTQTHTHTHTHTPQRNTTTLTKPISLSLCVSLSDRKSTRLNSSHT